MSDENNNQEEEKKNTQSSFEETTENFKEGAKNTANEFKEGWNQATNNGENKKVIAGILAIVFGWLGVHKFILGYTQEGVIMAVVGLVGWFLCGIPTMIVGVIALVEGIIYLTKSDEEFYNTYQVGKKAWF